MSVKKIESTLYDFAKSLVGSRVLDLYLKYNGIKMLTTATLVPFALILGKNVFEQVVLEQTGGTKLPVLDDPLLGNALKLGGLTTLANITPDTLLPLGVLMLVYNMIKRGQSGGAISLTKYAKELFNNRGLDLFMKYQGLKMLSGATLVPFALLFSRDMVQSLFQNGGALLPVPKKLPFVDDPLFGNYLKLAGLSVATLGPQTLVPLGVLMILMDTYFLEDLFSDTEEEVENLYGDFTNMVGGVLDIPTKILVKEKPGRQRSYWAGNLVAIKAHKQGIANKIDELTMYIEKMDESKNAGGQSYPELYKQAKAELSALPKPGTAEYKDAVKKMKLFG